MKHDRVEVRRADGADVARYYSQQPTEYYGLFVAGEPIALAGFQIRDGRTWVYLDLPETATVHRIRVVRAALRGLIDRNETVYAPCAVHIHAGAERLLRWLGFNPTDETVASYRGEMRVWVWQKWPC